MLEIKELKDCCGCHACYNACPVNAINMVENKEGFLFPIIDKEKCINCGKCERVCPIINKSIVRNQPQVYACYNKDEGVRLKSSSGGIFALLAQYIIQNGGVVFGAAFNNNNTVEHIYIDNIEELHKLQGSKYMQSNIANTYKVAEEFLKSGKLVLFTGTPCQIEGFKSYLQKDYDNLYTQDIICHGVPSPKVWKEYLKSMNSSFANEKVDINFRNKDNGWSKYNVTLQSKHNVRYKQIHTKDLFMKSFIGNLCLRESCYDCKFKSKNRNSDVTLADFWGINNVLPDMNDEKGTSLVVVNSKKGISLFEEIKSNIMYKEVELEKAISMNPSMVESSKYNINREKFFEELGTMQFDKLVNKYVPKTSVIRRSLSFAKRIINKIIKDRRSEKCEKNKNIKIV